MSLRSDPRRGARKLHPATPLLDRVLLRVTVDEHGCWIFGGAIDSGGYGVVRDHGRNERAHVVTFRAEHSYTPAERGLVIDHLCRVRACCRPDHLEGVSAQVNTFERAWHSSGLPKLTHCHRGHEMTEANTYRRPDGKGRQCRACIEIRWRRRAVRHDEGPDHFPVGPGLRHEQETPPSNPKRHPG